MPKFTPEFLDELKSRVRVSDVVGRHVKLQKRGSTWWGLSPFKTEKTPSFTVSDERRSYHCFSTDSHGDAIKFLQETQGLSFVEAVTRLAEDAGMEIPKDDPKAAERAKVRRGLADACGAAAAFFAKALRAREGREAYAYLARRDVSEGAIEAFEIGYAPSGRTSLRDHLLKDGFSEASLIEAGLIIKPEDGGATFDRFRGRVMFPIRRGRDVIAFGGRALDPNARAKYLNSPETPIFRKGEVLYNYDAARSASASASAAGEGEQARLIVCEGYMDAIALWGAGFKGAVAPLGTALTEEQLRLLWRADDEPIVCLDGDAAGLKAAHRALDRALPMLGPGRSLRFVFLPDGKDPDDLVRESGAGGLKKALDEAVPLVEVLWRRERDAGALDTPERGAAFRKRLRELVRSIGDADVRAAYGQEIASRLDGLKSARSASETAPSAQVAGRPADKARGSGGGRWRGRYRSEHDARLQDSRPSAEALRARPGGGRSCEATLALCAVRRPELVRAHEEIFLSLALQDAELDSLIGEIVDAVVADPDLDSEGLRRHVERSPAADTLDALLNDHWLQRQAFLRPDAGPSEVEAGWLATWRRYALATQVERELIESASSVFSEGDESWRAAARARSDFAISRRNAADEGDEGGASSEDLKSRLDRARARFD